MSLAEQGEGALQPKTDIIAKAKVYLAQVLMHHGQAEKGEALIEPALALQKLSGTPQRMGDCYYFAARAYVGVNDMQTERYLLRAHDAWRQADAHRLEIGDVRCDLAQRQAKCGQYTVACSLINAAMSDYDLVLGKDSQRYVQAKAQLDQWKAAAH